jgi:hypothetical protein
MSDFVSAPAMADARAAFARLHESMARTIRGKDEVIERVLVCPGGWRACADRGPPRSRQDDLGLFAGAIDGLRLLAHPVYRATSCPAT